jgi:hypothetical protein
MAGLPEITLKMVAWIFRLKRNSRLLSLRRISLYDRIIPLTNIKWVDILRLDLRDG